MATEKKITQDDIDKARAVIAEAEQEQAAAKKKALEEAMAPKKFKAGNWVCVEDCYHNGTLYKVGTVVTFKKTEDAPVANGFVRHFQPEA